METEGDSRGLGSLVPHLDLSDVDRIQYLYSPFRPRELNPKGYDEKLTFWSDAIAGICSRMNSSIISLSSLKNLLRLNDSSPRGLEVVLSELRGSKKILPLWHDGSWSSWALDLAHSRVFNIKAEDTFVHIESLNVLMEDFSKWMRDNSELRLHHWNYSRLRTPFVDRNDIEPCLKRLQASGEISLLDLENGERWIRLNTRHPESALPPPSEEGALLKLTQASETIRKRLTELEEKESSTLKRTKELLSKGQRERAKTQLLKNKRIKRSLLENDGLLDRIESLLESVSASGDQKEAMRSLQAGNEALKNALTLEEVNDVMDEVNEMLEKSHDVSEALSSEGDGLDESLLLAELEKLEKEEESSKDPLNDTKSLIDALNNLKIPDSSIPQPSIPQKARAQLA
eukprot:TRINITY_DN5507_c0_g1_i1.p1 TRINITY_DN5507_c0_g1~~TRINITY_DN5507_c0_g1_i1.p1  ORF type:complete len:401 (-),score=90.29 TRINITY_DN5507_c0_g1_i1:81-1283(-)